MRWLAAKFECPLLARELTQLSTQRRIYFARVLFACALYGGVLWYYGTNFGQAAIEQATLFGQGRRLFELLIKWQFWGIFLLMPATTAGAITSEKERGALGLLKLTRLSGWRVLLEKLSSRLLVIGSFLLVPIPLEAVAYGWGGVENDDMIKAAYVLALTAIQVGWLSLFCSTVCRTTVQAMTLSYMLMVIAYYVGHEITSERWRWTFDFHPGNSVIELFGPYLLQAANSDNVVELSMVMDVFFYNPNGLPLRLPTIGSASSTVIVFRSLPMLASILILMALSRFFLWRSADGQLNRPWFAAAQRWFDEIPFRSRDGRILMRRRTSAVPVDAPIAWRECRRRWVGNWEHIAVVLAIVEIPPIYWIALSSKSIGSYEGHVAGAWNFLWIAACLTIILISAGLFATDRTRQTLDVLLATPLTGSEILLQKMSGLLRLTLILMAPLATVLLLQVSVLNLSGEDSAEQAFGVNEFMMLDSRTEAQWIMLVLRRATAICLYLPLLAWIGLQYGLRIRNHIGAILATLITVVAACVLPVVLQRLCLSMYPPDTFAAAALHRLLEWINPWFVACRDEGFGLGAFDGFSISDVLPEDWFAYLFHFLLVGGMLWGVRRNALVHFGRLIGRLEPQYARYERPAIPLSLQKLPMDRTEFLIVDDKQGASSAGPASGTKNE